jgi:probable rRNA maturation factor
MAIEIQVAATKQDVAGMPAQKLLRNWARAALAAEVESQAVTIRVVGADEGTTLNETYRPTKHGPTNVLSFPFEAPPGVKTNILGDIVICAPVVAREAKEQGKNVAAHWCHMVIHGVLHLQGFDHVKAVDAKKMEAKEIDVLHKLGFGDPYAYGERNSLVTA